MRSLQFYVSGKRPIQSLVYCRQHLACENEHHLISLKAAINEVVVSAGLVIPNIGLVIKKNEADYLTQLRYESFIEYSLW